MNECECVNKWVVCLMNVRITLVRCAVIVSKLYKSSFKSREEGAAAVATATAGPGVCLCWRFVRLCCWMAEDLFSWIGQVEVLCP